MLGITFQTWGLFFAIAALAGFLMLIKEAKRKKVSLDLAYNLYFIGFFAGIIGARTFYFLIHPQYFSATGFLYFWQGGYILFGGALLALIFIILYLYFKKEPILNTLNLLVIPGLISLIIVRFGSVLIQDNIGQITILPWAINFLGETRHPIDLYFILLDILLLGLAFFLDRIKKNRSLFFWIMLFLSVGRLIIHSCMTFISAWDANLDIIFWSLALIISLVLLGYNYKETKELNSQKA